MEVQIPDPETVTKPGEQDGATGMVIRWYPPAQSAVD